MALKSSKNLIIVFEKHYIFRNDPKFDEKLEKM